MKHILIIDDDPHIGNVLEEALTAEGYVVSRAYSGTEALLLLLLNPLGQQIQIANAGLEHPLWSSLSSVALSVLATLGGLLIFRKKDIK